MIASVAASNITSYGATISWATDEEATSVVEYGLTLSLGSTTQLGTLSSDHSVNLIGLASNTVYFYRVRSVDADGNASQSDYFSFTTLPDPPTSGITDYGTYVPPAPPTLPKAGGTFVDPVFGTTIMRLTDANDGRDNLTMYSYWPSFNKDSTRIWVQTDGTAYLYDFDPINFTASNKRLFFRNRPSGIAPSTEDMIWSNIDPAIVYFHDGLEIWSYNVDTTEYAQVKNFTGILPTGSLYQMSKSEADNVFAFTRRDSSFRIAGYIAWRKDTDTLTRIDRSTLDEVQVDKTGRYVMVKTGQSGRGVIEGQVLDLQTGSLNNLTDDAPDYNPGHSDNGRGFVIGHDNWVNRELRRDLSTPHSYFSIFDWPDWTQDSHLSLLAENEAWILISSYSSGPAPPGPFHEELFLVATDGSKRVRRLGHHQSIYRSYWDSPRANISRDGRFAVFTSNWGNSNRRDVFIIKIPR